MKVFLMLVVGAVLSAQFVDAKMDNDTTQIKEKQHTKEKKSNTQLPKGTLSKTQVSAGVNKPSNKPSKSAFTLKVPALSNKHQSSFKLPDGISIPAGIPTGIPGDIVGKATKKLKNHFGKSAWHSTPKTLRKSNEK